MGSKRSMKKKNRKKRKLLNNENELDKNIEKNAEISQENSRKVFSKIDGNKSTIGNGKQINKEKNEKITIDKQNMKDDENNEMEKQIKNLDNDLTKTEKIPKTDLLNNDRAKKAFDRIKETIESSGHDFSKEICEATLTIIQNCLGNYEKPDPLPKENQKSECPFRFDKNYSDKTIFDPKGESRINVSDSKMRLSGQLKRLELLDRIGSLKKSNKCLNNDGDSDSDNSDSIYKPTDEPRYFHCLHCRGKFTNQNRFYTCRDVYQHWCDEHNDASRPEPFLFYTTENVRCFHCGEIGSYWELMVHHRIVHPEYRFIISDPLNEWKCAFCSYIGIKLAQHFQKHRIYMKNFNARQIDRMWNPSCLTDEAYDERIGIRLHQKLKCSECPMFFDTEKLVTHHFLVHHRQAAMRQYKYNFRKFYDKSKYMICACCELKIHYKQFSEHFQKRNFQFSCERCTYVFHDLINLMIHDRIMHNEYDSSDRRCSQYVFEMKKFYTSSQIIHGNGFVLTNQNIIGTKYDHWIQQRNWIDEMVQTMKLRLHCLTFTD